MFISFEGLDGSGKTTQIQLLAKRLEQNGKKVKVLREPGGTVISEKIREILLSKSHKEMAPIAEIFLFSSARAQLVAEVIKPSLEQNVIVICDRYVDSSTAYQGFGRGIPIEYIQSINHIATGGLLPDVTFFIDIPVEESIKRRLNSRKHIDRMEEGEHEYFQGIYNGFMTIAKKEPGRFLRIGGMNRIEHIQEEIWNILAKKLVI